jgi:ribosome biogenesis protein MAK21
MLLSQIMATKPMLRTLLEQPEDDDEEEEHFVDAPDSDDEAAPESAEKPADASSKAGGGPVKTSTYDPLKREPMYAGAERSSFWELLQVRNWFKTQTDYQGRLWSAGLRL